MIYFSYCQKLIRIILLAVMIAVPSVCYASGKWISDKEKELKIKEDDLSLPITIERLPIPQIIWIPVPRLTFEIVVVNLMGERKEMRIMPVTKWEFKPILIFR